MKWWILVVVLIIIYAIISEIRSQDCWDNNKLGYCDNRVEPPTTEDSVWKIINQTVEASRKNHTLVGWRRAMIVALVSMILLMSLFRKWDGMNFTLGALIIFVVSYTLIGAIQLYHWRPWDRKIEEKLKDWKQKRNVE